MYTFYPVIIYNFLGEKEKYLFYPPDFESITITSENLKKGFEDIKKRLEVKYCLYSTANIAHPLLSDFKKLCQFKNGPTIVLNLIDELFNSQVTQVTEVGIRNYPTN